MNGPAAQTGAQDSGDDVPSKRPHLLFGNVSFTESERSRIQKCLNMKLSGDFISYRPGAGGSEVCFINFFHAINLVTFTIYLKERPLYSCQMFVAMFILCIICRFEFVNGPPHCRHP